MLLRQIEYFIAVSDRQSFTEAAEALHISQSAVSQQIKALENELGTALLSRHNRTFSLTPAGELFYRKAAVILSDVEKMIKEVKSVNDPKQAVLRIGYLNCYGGTEFQDAVSRFSEKYPEVRLSILSGNHENLYEALVNETVDLVLTDQRRAFAEGYVNFELVRSRCFIEIASHHPFSRFEKIETEDLKNIPCILVSRDDQQQTEESYYRDILGFRGDFLFAHSLQEARLMVVSGQGFLPVEGIREDSYYDMSIVRIPLYRKDVPVRRNYCAFWKEDNSGYYIEEFADILKSQFV